MLGKNQEIEDARPRPATATLRHMPDEMGRRSASELRVASRPKTKHTSCKLNVHHHSLPQVRRLCSFVAACRRFFFFNQLLSD